MQVRQFQVAIGAPLPEEPTMLDEKRASLRQNLLEEEVNELKEATDMEGVADALCDILYITLGTAHEYGIADRLNMLFDEVQRSNMSKFDDEGKPIYREDGKVMKSENYRPPNFKSILNRKFMLLAKSVAGEDQFEDTIMEMARLETERWNKRVEDEILKRMGFFSRMKYKISKSLENNLRGKIKVTNTFDFGYRKRATIEMNGEEFDVIDY